MPHLYRSVVLAGAAVVAFSAVAQSSQDKKWCPPSGPKIEGNLPTLLSEGQQPSFKPGWAVIAMHVKPGAQPVSDVRVVSESGSDALARTWLPLVKQWVGCAENEREVIYQVRFTHGIMGIPTFPTKEAFSIRAFREPRGEPQLPPGDWGVGICPIRATLTLRQPNASNLVGELEGSNRPEVRAWLETMVPDLEYMRPNKESNRVEFECKVSDGKVNFFAH